jgi:hypothetical protein
MLIVRTITNKPGKITVEASAEGLKPAKTSLTSEQ